MSDNDSVNGDLTIKNTQYDYDNMPIISFQRDIEGVYVAFWKFYFRNNRLEVEGDLNSAPEAAQLMFENVLKQLCDQYIEQRLRATDNGATEDSSE